MQLMQNDNVSNQERVKYLHQQLFCDEISTVTH
jgi:hypothetical protein